MREEFKGYCLSLYEDIPGGVYVGLVTSLIVFAMVAMAFWGWRKCWRRIVGFAAFEYVFLIYCSTVFFRGVGNGLAYNFLPFWSYGAYFRGEDSKLLSENIMNVVVFIPVGLLLGVSFRSMSWVKALGIGCCISLGIEILQLILKRGFCELDDVMHNTLGCVMGFGIYRLIYMCANSKKKRVYGK